MLIAFTGLPSAGKSSTAAALGQLLNAEWFLEPEEEHWPQLVHDRQAVGHFTALTWFRSARVPALYSAFKVSRSGGIAIVDSYYDKLISLYMQQDCFSWLMPKTDPYFDCALAMARTDYRCLPTADVLIFLKLEEAVWNQFMSSRGRIFDQTAELSRQFEMQKHFEKAARVASTELGIKLIVVAQNWSSPSQTATTILDLLRADL